MASEAEDDGLQKKAERWIDEYGGQQVIDFDDRRMYQSFAESGHTSYGLLFLTELCQNYVSCWLNCLDNSIAGA